MKNAICGLVVFVMLCFLCVGVVAAKPDETILELHLPIHQAIATEDVDAFMRLLDPSIEREIDRPVLLAWMKGLNQAAGEPTNELNENLGYHVKFTPEAKQIHTRGNFQFSNATVDSAIVLQNGLIVGFTIQTDAMIQDWFDGPTDSKMYFKRAETVLMAVIENRYQDATPLMHDSLLEAATNDTLDGIREFVVSTIGDIQSISAQGGEFENTAEADRLVTNFKIVGTNGVVHASATTIFDGLKGEVLSINYAPAETADFVAAN